MSKDLDDLKAQYAESVIDYHTRSEVPPCRGSDPMGSDFTHMRRGSTVQGETPNYAQMAVETGQLVYHDDVLDDDEGSPTYDQYVPVFYGTPSKEAS